LKTEGGLAAVGTGLGASIWTWGEKGAGGTQKKTVGSGMLLQGLGRETKDWGTRLARERIIGLVGVTGKRSNVRDLGDVE